MRETLILDNSINWADKSICFNFKLFFLIDNGWWGAALIEIDLDRNRGLELQQAWSNDEVGWSAGVGLFG